MERDINVADVVKYLSRAFSRATHYAANQIGSRATRSLQPNGVILETTKLYDYQVEFCYLIDNIMRGPRYIATKNIQYANELIAEIESLVP